MQRHNLHKHHNSKQLRKYANYFLGIWQVDGHMYGIHDVVSHLTKSGVGCEIICNSEGGCQIVGPGPTGKVTGLTSKIGWTEVTPVCSFLIGVGCLNVSCALQLRWAATVLDLILFRGGCPSNCKESDVRQAVLLLDALDFFSLTVTLGGGG